MDEALKALPVAEAEKKPRTRERKPKSPMVPKRGLWFAPPPGSPEAKALEKEKKPKAPRTKFKNDPKLVAAARELRDRYTEQINAGLLLPPSANGKYDVSRQLEAAPSSMKITPAVALLEAA
jgi:hypothetical protein